MNENLTFTLKTIKKDRQIIKFCYYGFLKNLRFFEPFLVLYLLSMDLNLFMIGILYSIREIVNYIFEVPSGVFADNFGKKTELSLCFIFYIISFIFFFIGQSYWILIIAMFFFGLGEAFRSGTHKAMIFGYLEDKDWFAYKNFVYGRTRSFSLIGSAVSAFLSILFIIQFDSLQILFLICIIPYIADFILILSYPASFNEKQKTKFHLGEFIKSIFFSLKKISMNKDVLKIITSSSSFDAIFKSIKDYIQPILQGLLLSSSVVLFKPFDTKNTLEIYLAIVYGLIYILSSIASRNVYRLNKIKSSEFLMDVSFDILGIVFVLISIFIQLNFIYIVVPLYFLIFILKDARRPVFVDVIGDHIEKQERVTILSVETQFKALFVAIFAPLFGLVADCLSMSILFMGLAGMSFLISRLTRVQKKEKTHIVPSIITLDGKARFY